MNGEKMAYYGEDLIDCSEVEIENLNENGEYTS
jgi:hypothetical protein